MDGLGRAVGAPSHIMWRGRLTPIRLRLHELGEIEQYLLAMRPNPLGLFRGIAKFLSPAAIASVHDEAMALAVENNGSTLEDLQVFLLSREGVAFVIWLNQRDRDEWGYEETLAEVKTLGDDALDEISSRIMQAGGIDEFAHCDWPHMSDDGERSRINWRRLLRESFDEHGDMPDEFGRQTLYQIQTVGRDKKDITARARIAVDEYKSLDAEQRKEMRLSARCRGRTWSSLYGDAGRRVGETVESR